MITLLTGITVCFIAGAKGLGVVLQWLVALLAKFKGGDSEGTIRNPLSSDSDLPFSHKLHEFIAEYGIFLGCLILCIINLINGKWSDDWVHLWDHYTWPFAIILIWSVVCQVIPAVEEAVNSPWITGIVYWSILIFCIHMWVV